jgi:exonuclease SbcD
MVDMAGKGELTTTVLPLTPLRGVKVIRGTLEEVLRETCVDYVSIRLTDKVDLDVLDMQERLREAFPGLLEIRREVVRTADYSAEAGADREEAPDPFALCCSFLSDLTEEEKAILEDVINQIQEGGR